MNEPPPSKRICSDEDAVGAPRDFVETVTSTSGVQQGENQEVEGTFVKLGRRRKFAVFLSYSGKGYMGMQK